jgi:hypothetical protein
MSLRGFSEPERLNRLASYAGIEISPPDDDYVDDDNDGDIANPPWLVPRVMTTFDWVMTTFDWVMMTFDSQLAAAQDIGIGVLIYFAENVLVKAE